MLFLSDKLIPPDVVVAPTKRFVVEAVFANTFVEVEFVIVALVAEKFSTDKIFAQRVARTFKFVIDEVEIVVVPRVVVAADNVFSTDVPVAVRLPVASEELVAFPVVAFPDTESAFMKNCPAAVRRACVPT